MKLRNILLTAAGIFLLGFGTVGVFVPILPTTPFVIGASACFVVNPRMHSWLFKIKFFHEHFINYQNRTGLQKNTVVVSLGFLWGTLCISMLIVSEVWCTLLLTCVGIAVTVHILLIERPAEKRKRQFRQKIGRWRREGRQQRHCGHCDDGSESCS